MAIGNLPPTRAAHACLSTVWIMVHSAQAPPLPQLLVERGGHNLRASRAGAAILRRILMNNIIYIIGLVVVVIAILSFLGMR